MLKIRAWNSLFINRQFLIPRCQHKCACSSIAIALACLRSCYLARNIRLLFVLILLEWLEIDIQDKHVWEYTGNQLWNKWAYNIPDGLSPCFSEMANLVVEKSSSSPTGSVTFKNGFHWVRCLNVCGTPIWLSRSFLVGCLIIVDFMRVSQNSIWLENIFCRFYIPNNKKKREFAKSIRQSMTYQSSAVVIIWEFTPDLLSTGIPSRSTLIFQQQQDRLAFQMGFYWLQTKIGHTSKWSGTQMRSVIGKVWLCSMDDRAQYFIWGVLKYDSSSKPGFECKQEMEAKVDVEKREKPIHHLQWTCPCHDGHHVDLSIVLPTAECPTGQLGRWYNQLRLYEAQSVRMQTRKHRKVLRETTITEIITN